MIVISPWSAAALCPRYDGDMGEPPKRRATYDDVLAAPEGVIAELIHGTLVTQPRPAAIELDLAVLWAT